MTSSPLLTLRVARKAFGGTVVLQDIGFALHERQTVALLGPSGCGKSTLLRIAAGLDRDFDGAVERAPALAGRPGSVAIVFQEPRLMPWLTVAENVGFLDGKRADRARIARLLEEVGLADWGEALPKQLSGGMAQRVAIARGLYTRPRVLLLDEPFSAVDAFTRMKLQDLALEVSARHEIALLVVTHDIDEALYLSDRILVMGARPGRIHDTLDVAVPHPRERTDMRLAASRVDVLKTLHDVRAF